MTKKTSVVYLLSFLVICAVLLIVLPTYEYVYSAFGSSWYATVPIWISFS